MYHNLIKHYIYHGLFLFLRSYVALHREFLRNLSTFFNGVV